MGSMLILALNSKEENSKETLKKLKKPSKGI